MCSQSEPQIYGPGLEYLEDLRCDEISKPSSAVVASNGSFYDTLQVLLNSMVGSGVVDLDDPDLKSLVEFLKGSQKIDSIFPTKHGRYSDVIVLPIMWERVEEDRHLERDLKELSFVFQNRFNFQTQDIFKIPSTTDAHDILRDHILSHKDENDDVDKLLIIVYAGHGRRYREHANTGPMHFCDTEDAEHELDWSEIQANLFEAEGDVLVILNCCYAGLAALGDNKGTNEILAACGRETKTYTGAKSFLKYLTTKLESLLDAGERITVEVLEQELDYYNTPAGGHMLSRPLRKKYPAGRRTIELKPLPPRPNSPDVPTLPTSQEDQIPEIETSIFVEFCMKKGEYPSQEALENLFIDSPYPEKIRQLRFYTASQLQKVFQSKI